MSIALILEIINGLMAAGSFAVDVFDKWIAIRDSLVKMQAAGRDPTADEWAALDTQIRDQLSQIDAIVKVDAGTP
jgi:hypothetical protein